MTESTIQPQKLQWRWVWITFAMYILFYILPILIVGNFFTNKIAIQIIGAWIFGGIIIVAAVAGFLSTGVTIWEPAIAGAGLVLAFFVCMSIYVRVFYNPSFTILGNFIGILVPTIIVFLLSLLGAWLGERVQKLLRTNPPESN
jgi:hypothetical protein